MTTEILARLGQVGFIPVITIHDAVNAMPLAQALINGGLPCAEITLRTSVAAEAICILAASFPQLSVGAGTVNSVSDAEAAVAAGARYIVAPGFDAAVVDWCLGRNIPVIPGVMTPTEVNMALSKGLSLLKYFPAEAAGGVRALQAISEPYAGVKFVPTGGITASNLVDYMRLPSVFACAGSWVATDRMIAQAEFDRIQELAAQAVKLVSEARAFSGSE
jgi:2-dehydro-3-deoxyphosphogluconate aldolase/(4S)-4-hydroxy-2-oxoglutarate aldolase